jgi:hypothetical protein
MTRREEIEELLKQEEFSAQELANRYKTILADVLEDLAHIQRHHRLKIRPAFCKACGFVFKERAKVKTPSKCPRCRKEWIEPCKFRIVKLNY